MCVGEHTNKRLRPTVSDDAKAPLPDARVVSLVTARQQGGGLHCLQVKVIGRGEAMFNAISCSALKLSLLKPDMIQAVVAPAIFRKGTQYAAENRVRISAASEVKLVSRVVSNSGTHEQTIELKDGDLRTQCSCRIEERPMCGHCVAALLEYHRGAKLAPGDQDVRAAPRRRAASAAAEKTVTRARDIKFSEISIFLEWLQPAIEALEAGEELPPPPGLGGSEIDDWTQTIYALAADRWENESVQAVMKAEIGARESQLAIAGQQLNAALDQVRAARAERDELELEAASYRAALAKLSDLIEQMNESERQARNLSAELAKKTAQLDTIAATFRDAAATVQKMIRNSPGSRQTAS